MTFACRKCHQAYEPAVLTEVVAWIAVEPWEKGLCAACKIEPVWKSEPVWKRR